MQLNLGERRERGEKELSAPSAISAVKNPDSSFEEHPDEYSE
jgi:hypothetical protein